MVVDASKKYNKSLSICGEIAADIKFIDTLIGLGIRKFSISPRHIFETKYKILSIDSLNSKKRAEPQEKLLSEF